MKWINVRKKPVEVHAFLITEEWINKVIDRRKETLVEWDEGYCPVALMSGQKIRFIGASEMEICHIEIETLEGDVIGTPGTYLMKGVNDEIYPCAGGIFDKTYDIIDAEEELEFVQ